MSCFRTPLRRDGKAKPILGTLFLYWKIHVTNEIQYLCWILFQRHELVEEPFIFYPKHPSQGLAHHRLPTDVGQD